MRRNNLSGVVIVSLLAGMAGAYILPALGIVHGAGDTKIAAKETAYERVMRTQTLRCGYVVDVPHVIPRYRGYVGHHCRYYERGGETA